MCDVKVELQRLFDGKLSLRVEGEEVYLLPDKESCTGQDLELAFSRLAKHLRSLDKDELRDLCQEEAYEEIKRSGSLSW